MKNISLTRIKKSNEQGINLLWPNDSTLCDVPHKLMQYYFTYC